ncbi:signal peptidase I [Streptomyces avicenniae]|uniref:signal peptidase I n=1 Tax=Streptomyces avicenniae TaxID=500153 RepID=UPI000B0BF1E0|nr:signal peptidase I [Streptomyces avicenniae]
MSDQDREPYAGRDEERAAGGAPRARHGAGGHRRAGGGRARHDAAGAVPDEPRTTLRGPGEGRADRRRAAKRIKRRRRLRATREIPLLVGTALLIALVLKSFLVQAFVIPSGSMEQTIRINDRVLVDKLTPWFGWKPERGDVVVFRDPGGWLHGEPVEQDESPVGVRQVRDALTWIGLLPSADDQDLIKRVIGLGGDTVVCCDSSGRITVNGAPLDEPYLHPGDAPSQITFEVTVPQGRIFVLGDHRSNSSDSRYHLDEEGQGTVPVDLLVGRAVVIAWPFSHWRGLGDGDPFADVPEPGAGAASARAGPVATVGANEMASLPIPAELPLVMGVVGLSRRRIGLERSVRSGCGGCGGGCASGCGRARGRPAGDAGRRSIRRGIPPSGRRLGAGGSERRRHGPGGRRP